MTPLLPLLLLLAAVYAPAAAGPGDATQGEVVSSTSTRDVTQTQSSTSQSSEMQQIVSGDFRNTTNTTRSTARQRDGELHERAASQPDGNYTLRGQLSVEHSDDNKTAASGTERTQTVERTRAHSLDVSGAGGSNPLHLSKVHNTRDEHVTRTGPVHAGTESGQIRTDVSSVRAGDPTVALKVSKIDQSVLRSVNESAPVRNAATVVQVMPPQLGEETSTIGSAAISIQRPTTTTPPPTPKPTLPPTSKPTPPPTPKPTQPPTPKPTQPPTPKPTQPPTPKPTQPPTPKPTPPPTPKPTPPPTPKPTQPPTHKPTKPPTPKPTQPPTHKPTKPPTPKAFEPLTFNPITPAVVGSGSGLDQGKGHSHRPCPACQLPCKGREQQGCCWISLEYCFEGDFTPLVESTCNKCWENDEQNDKRWEHYN